MQSEGDSLWESFPHALRTHEGAGRYINAFQAPFQELPTLSPQQIYTLWAYSLFVIPPPIWRTVPQGGFLTDLTELNLSGWAALVQDVAAGLQALPPRLSHDLGPQMVTLLQLLEVATGVGFCRHCCNPRPHCWCTGASQSAPPPPPPPTSWSQIVGQTPGYGVTASSGGMTTPSTSVAGMPGYVTPPPGLTPPDFSIWSLPSLEAPLPKELPTSPQNRPPVWRSTQMRDALDRWAQAPRALAPQALVLCAPQVAPPIHLPLPCRPATLYQQVVQLPGRSTGLGVTFDSSADKAALTGGQDAKGHGRQST